MKAEIIVENGGPLFIFTNIGDIESFLGEVNIGFGCIELRSGPQASLFHGIGVYINEHLTSLIINGLLMPGAYDSMKFVFRKMVNSIKTGPFRAVNEDKALTINLKFTAKDWHLEAPIPNNLSDEQFDSYMEMLQTAIKSINKAAIKDVSRKEQLVADFEHESGRVVVKTLPDYGRSKWEKQLARMKQNKE